MYSELVRAIERGADILLLTAGLLRLCREHLAELHRLDGEPGIWREREALRRRCEQFFADVDDEELDQDELDELREIALSRSRTLPAVIVAHTIAEAVDVVLGSRFLPMFMGRKVVLAPGDPIPVPHPDWRRFADRFAEQVDARADVSGMAIVDPWAAGDDQGDDLDATAHLRLAADWAEKVRVILDGNWRRWHVMPQPGSGDRLACATPNRSLAELTFARDLIDGEPVFFDARWGLDPAEQLGRCLALLDLARAQGCRLVAFPELSVAQSARQAIGQWLESQTVVDMVVAGSSHVPAGDGRWHNEATVYVRGLPTPIVHRKFSPMALRDPASAPRDQRVVRREHLAASAPELSAQLSPHWTLVVLVSADAIADPVPAVLADLRANLVLVPAIAFDTEDFRALAAALAIHCQALTVVANACVAPDVHEDARGHGSTDPGGDLSGDPGGDPGGSLDGDRPPVLIGLPSYRGAVLMDTPPPCSLLVVTLGSPGQKPFVVTCPDPTG